MKHLGAADVRTTAYRVALAEIHNPGAARHNGIDLLELIDTAMAKAKGKTLVTAS